MRDAVLHRASLLLTVSTQIRSDDIARFTCEVTCYSRVHVVDADDVLRLRSSVVNNSAT